ncbi:MAG: Tim44/TimA family putative adaptor protein [Novosphingobium sp.]|nr:Tim44/TimA family putative adaptor protein [Novosphingobium sp.]
MIVEIVILAMIAAFLGLRLYAVLGRRPEQNEEPLRRRVEQPDPASAPRALAPRLPEKASAAPRALPLPQDSQLDSRAEAGIRAIIGADRRFDVGQFVAGARGAYGMVLEAFWRGDKDELSQLCDADVAAGFAAAIDARGAAGEAITAKLIRIEEARIVDASYAAPRARITVSFVADVASVTRDANGAVVAGSLDDAIETRDVWTFSRDLTSRDPDWVVDETDEG